MMHALNSTHLLEQIRGAKAGEPPGMREETTRLPLERYHDAGRLQTEQALFRRSPMVVAHASELRNAGDFVTLRAPDKPLLVTRGHDGKLRAFVNCCRHRGSILEKSPRGNKKSFTCPYHAWTYDSAGCLQGIPHAHGFPDQKETGLTPLPVHEEDGMVFVVPPSPDADSVNGGADIPAEFRADFKELGLAELAFYDFQPLTIKANWKFIMEGSLEFYHFKMTHRNTIAASFMNNMGILDRVGRHMRLVLPQNTAPANDPSEKKEDIRGFAHLVYFLFPGTLLLVEKDHVSMLTALPMARDETLLLTRTLVPEAKAHVSRYWDKRIAFTMKTLQEDYDAFESMQANVTSGGNTHLTFGRFEHGAVMFNEILDEELRL